MTKVCFIVSSLCNEGPVNVMYNIIQYMDFSLFEVSIITLIPEKKSSRLKDFKQLPIQIYQLTKEKFLRPWSMFFQLKSKVEEINPDILHSHCPRSLYLSYFLPKKYKKVYTIHIYPGLQQEILYGKWKGKIVNILNHYFTYRMDLAIGCAESVSSLYLQNKGWKIHSIPNGCSHPLWEKDNNKKKQIRKLLGLKESIQYFIFIGRFSYEKNPDFLVKAFQALPQQNIGIILLGTGPLWEHLKKYENDRIILPGFKTNVYEYLIAADFYISASDVEGLANTILESMTVGLPMLLSDIPSHKEVLNKMSKCVGFIYDHHDINNLHQNISNIISLNKEEVSDEIRSVFIRYYTAQRMSESYQKAYLNIHN